MKTKIKILGHAVVLLSLCQMATLSSLSAQGPGITSWLLKPTGITGSRYAQGSSTLIPMTDSANVQTVYYSANNVYIRTKGVPAYPTGPFLDGNPSITTNQNAIFRFPLNPAGNTGTPVATTMGNIGVFINGVALFDCRDGVYWNATTNSLCGGPGNPPCPGGPGGVQPWSRDAIVAERAGFDCSKGHPAMGNYHHHQNPSAFDLDLVPVSTVCNLYDADGLYAIDSMQHSPLLGFAYDGFPIYGAYGYQDVNGSGPIVRIRSGYHLRNITTRTTSPTGATVTAGPPVSATYPLGYFREDYEYITPSPTQTEVLDEHNGRFCVTPEFPGGTYAYFCTVDSLWNSAYPYAVGPTFYGTIAAAKVTSITEPVTEYTPINTAISSQTIEPLHVYPNPASDFIALQWKNLNRAELEFGLYDITGKEADRIVLHAGQSIGYFDTQRLYAGIYFVRMIGDASAAVKRVMIQR